MTPTEEQRPTLLLQADARTGLIGAAPTDDETNRKNMTLLIQLRWIAVDRPDRDDRRRSVPGSTFPSR